MDDSDVLLVDKIENYGYDIIDTCLLMIVVNDGKVIQLIDGNLQYDLEKQANISVSVDVLLELLLCK